MTDPVYEYKNGEGWVAIFNTFYFTDSEGNRVLAEVRMPEVNECYYRYSLVPDQPLDTGFVLGILSERPYNRHSRRGGWEDEHYTNKTLIVLTKL